MRNILTATLLFVLLVTTISVAQPTFTKNVNASLVINQIGGTKEGGAVWADFDNDGNLDVAVNTGNSGSSNTSLFQNNGDGTFTDVTSTYINDIGTGNDCCERSLAWGDLNNDGFIDLIGNTYNQIEIYLNRGTDTTPNFMFGVGAGMTPNMVITSMTDGMNSEGLGIMDYNNDGWLDIVVENDQYGIDIFRNDKTGTRGTASTFFTQVTLNSSGNLGLPSGPGGGSADKGDYLATGDYDNDGFMDILGRKHGGMDDLWTNDQDGTFTVNSSFSEGVIGSSGNKGGVVFCDFDTDGDFDIFWTDEGTNQIWLQDPTGTFTATSKPTLPGTPDIDGCACGDVDNDGDIDLFLGNNTGNSYLFINTTSNPNSVADLSFTRTDIAVNANAEGVNLVDYDNDGDVDIYVNVNGGNNQLWDNDNCDGGGCDFFKVVTQDCIDGTTVTRPVVGGTMVLKDDIGNIVNASQDMNSAMGHGAQNPAILNFSTPDPSATYTLDITFPAKIIAPSTTPTVETYSYDFVPNDLVANTLTITSLNASDGSTCDFSPLPIELLYFKGTIKDKTVILRWVTVSEINNDFFTIERSNDGRMFYEIGIVQGVGNSNIQNNYLLEDNNPLSGLSYYRLKQTDYDGQYSYSKIIVVKLDHGLQSLDFTLFPNPTKNNLSVQVTGNAVLDPYIEIYNAQGQRIKTVSTSRRIDGFELNVEHLNTGLYLVHLINGDYRGVRKFVKQ